jgi:hypothetical protein
MEKLKVQFENGSISVHEYNAALEQMRTRTEMNIQHQTHMSERIMGVASVAMSLSQILNSMKSFSEIFNEDSTTMEKVTAGLSALASVTFGVISLQKGLTTVFAKNIAAKMGDVAASAAQTAATATNTAATATNTASIWANTFALLSNPWTAAATIVTITAAGVVMAALNKKVQDNTKALEEDTAAAKENLETAKESIDAHKDLLQNFKDAYEEYQETKVVTNELRSATEDLTSAYDIQGGKLALLTGNYEDYIIQLKKARQEELKLGKKDATSTMNMAGDEMAYKFQQYSKDQGWGADGTLIIDSGTSLDDEEAFKKIYGFSRLPSCAYVCFYGAHNVWVAFADLS